MVAGSCSCLESGLHDLSIPFCHFPDREKSCNGPRSVEVAEFSSKGHVGVVQYSASTAAYKGVLMHTDHSQRCNCTLAS